MGRETDEIVKPDTPELDVYLSHRTALIDYATPIVGCRARAEDLVQEAFIRFSARRCDAWNADGETQPGQIAHPVSYLYRIVRNLALDWLRRPDATVLADDSSRIDRLSALSVTPEQSAVQRDQLRLLAEALSELPERTRVAFAMHRLEGRSLKEIADHFDISVVRAHQLVKQAIRHGAQRLDRYD